MRWIWVLLAVAFACTACRARPLAVQGPLTANLSTPSDEPSAVPNVPTCLLADRSPGSGGTVRSRPSGVTAAWLPGMSSRDCRAVLTRGSAAQAQRLAHDIGHLPPFPSGPVNCPGEDGTAVQLVFAYGSHEYEQVLITLSGCAGMTTALAADLRPLAPAVWQSYVAG